MPKRGGRWSEQDLRAIGKFPTAREGTAARPGASVPFLRQPNEYTCGPTCIAMVARAVRAPSEKLPPGVIGGFAGTNSRTGTTEVEMARGLTFAQLAWRRGDARSLGELDHELTFNNLVLLRTLVGGGKHWVVVQGRAPGGYGIMCPSVGPCTWTEEQLLARWAARDFDHFVVPAAPIAHRPYALRIHERTLQHFTNFAAVIRDEEQAHFEKDVIANAAGALEKATLDPVNRLIETYRDWTFYRVPSRHFGAIGDMFGEHASDPGVAHAAIIRGTTYVDPPLRGTGGAVGLVLSAYRDQPRRFLNPGYFSEGGYATRVRAHAVAVQQALDAGLDVRPEVQQSNPIFNPHVSGPRYMTRSRSAAPLNSITLPATGAQGNFDFAKPPAPRPEESEEARFASDFGRLMG